MSGLTADVESHYNITIQHHHNRRLRNETWRKEHVCTRVVRLFYIILNEGMECVYKLQSYCGGELRHVYCRFLMVLNG